MLPRFQLTVGAWLLAGLCASLSFASPDPETGLPFLQLVSPRDYRGDRENRAVAEDAAGVLYFANFNKVLVYDGAHWSHLPVPGGYLRCLAVDRDDTLWVGGIDELGYARADATGVRTYVSLKQHLPAGLKEFTTWKVFPTPYGALFRTNDHLLRWDGTQFSALTLPTGRRWSVVAVGTEIWVTSNTPRGWFRVRDDGQALSLTLINTPPALNRQQLAGAVPFGQPGEFLLASNSRAFWRWDGRHFSRYPTTIDDALRRMDISSMCRLADGRIAVSSADDGVWLLDQTAQPLTHFSATNGLPTPHANLVYPTRDGTALWICLASGVARVDARPWLTMFDTANGAPRSQLRAPLRHHGRLYIPGTAAGLFRLEPASGSAPAQIVKVDFPVSHVNSLAIDENDTLMVSTNSGLFAMNDRDEATRVKGYPADLNKFMPYQGHPGTWIGVNRNRIQFYHRDGDGWQTDGPVPGLTQVQNVAVDHDGSLWVGRSTGGALHAIFRDGLDRAPTVETYTAPEQLPAGYGFTRFLNDAKGALLACDVGLYRFDPAKRQFRPTTDYGTELADGSTGIWAWTPDGQHGLWMVLVAVQDTDAETDRRVAYGRDGHLMALRLPQLSRIAPGVAGYDPKGEGRPDALWISCDGSLIRVDLDRWRAAPPEPPLVVSWREITNGGGHRLALAGGWKLPYRDRSLHVRFSAPTLAADADALYESTLESTFGREAHTDTRAERDFSALAAGSYTLRVRVRHRDGIWSQPVALAFAVLPPWWLSPLALAGYAAAALAVLAAAWRARTNRWRRIQHALEGAVAARTLDLARQNAELARLRQIEFDEKLAARLAEDKARLEVLRYQLNPHFLFNTLTSVCAQIIQSPRNARETVIRLAEFCRLTLHRRGDGDEPTVGEEIEMLHAYLDIEQTRLGALLEYSITCDPALTSVQLPPFLLLPLVENAVKYGAATSKDRVRIRLSLTPAPDGGVEIEVANSGHWISPASEPRSVPSLGIGLENLRQRLRRYYPDAHELTTASEEGWVRVKLRIKRIAS